MATLNVRGLGDYIRDQRLHSQVSLRQLARQAGVSNPYLSQIERGLRRPSAEILQQIAKALRISAEALYVQAGILDERDAEGSVGSAVRTDATINERQKQVLLDIYGSFRRENEASTRDDKSATASEPQPAAAAKPAPAAGPTPAVKPTAAAKPAPAAGPPAVKAKRPAKGTPRAGVPKSAAVSPAKKALPAHDPVVPG